MILRSKIGEFVRIDFIYLFDGKYK